MWVKVAVEPLPWRPPGHDVPWGERGSSFTALFETVVIDWQREASLSAVARRMTLIWDWDQVDGIMARVVRRGLLRRKRETVERIGVDETTFRKRQRYVTVVTDLSTARVVHIADERRRASLDSF